SFYSELFVRLIFHFSFFFFNDSPPTEIYTLSYTTLFRSLQLHAGFQRLRRIADRRNQRGAGAPPLRAQHLWIPAYAQLCKNVERDRKSTRLNSSHVAISYAVFCLKKKKKKIKTYTAKNKQ